MVRTLGSKRPRGPGTSGRRAIMVHVDGLSRAVLDDAMAAGRMPFLTRLLEARRHRCETYRAGAPASTSQFQAGLLYGEVDDVPGYLWYDKRTQRNVRMDAGEDVKRVEARHAHGRPGLLAGGVSYTTLFTGSAEVPCLNLGRVKTLQWNSNSRHWPLATAAAVHTVLGAWLWTRVGLEAIPSLFETIRHAARVGRFDWEGRLFGMKMLGIGLTEVATWGAIVEMARGVPIIYTCLVDYDEVAHRRGPRGDGPMQYLQEIDSRLEAIFAAAEALPELCYDVYVFSDHGQVETVPFAKLDPLGRDLPAFLSDAAAGEAGGAAPSARHVALRALGDRLASPAGWIAHQKARKYAEPPPGVEIVDAGDIAHLYFTDHEEPLPLSAIERLQPRILAALQTCHAIPFLVARGERGPIVVAGKRYLHLADPQHRAEIAALPAFRGRDRETLLGYLDRLIGMPSAGDLILYGNAGAGTSVAFSWEFGSHGGIGAEETEAFVISPRAAAFDFASVTLPEELHSWFVRYRPPLPAQQDVESAAGDDPGLKEHAAAAIAAGLALADPSARTLHSGCS